jgi:endo-1,4-beta-xylanase
MSRILGGLFALALIVSAQAENENAIMDKVVNTPAATAWSVNGATAHARDDTTVQGGKAIRIEVSSKGRNPWDVQASSAVLKPVAKGDIILVAFWARAEVPAEGETVAHISSIRFQLSGAPYTGIFDDSASVGGKWQMYYASGTADADYRPGSVTLTLQLASAKQTIDLGPVFILDFGPNYDRSKLPKNALPSSSGASASDPPPALATAESRFAAELTKLRALLPVHGQLMNDPAVSTVNSYGANQSSQTITAPDVTGGQALRVSVSKGTDPYLTGIASRTYGDIHKGDVLFLAFYARATEVSNEAQSGVISAFNVQQSGSPYTIAVGTAALVPLNSWRMFYASAVAPMDYPSGTAVLTAQVGSRKQTIDFGPAFVLNLGPGVKLSSLPVNRISYPGREPNAPWRAAAEARIRQIRMGDFRVNVTDASGKPVPGAVVHFAMQKHRFRFGTFIGHNIANATGADADKQRQSFLDSFNFATSPIYWSDWAWQNPSWRANYIASMKWLQEHGDEFRLHTVIYPREDLTPTKIKKLAGDQAAVHAAILDHVHEVVPFAVKYGACCLDVVNEPRDGQTYLPGIAGETIFADVYKTTHEIAPKAELFVNEYGIIEGGGTNEKNIDFYHHWIEDMLARGAPVSGIGFQGHFGADLTDPAHVLALMDEFARYKLPLEITEFDVDTTDEEAQADYTRDFLTAVFSHPSADAFVMWGWWEGDHWKPAGAMLRRDWSEKPNYKVWKKLIYHDWWTDESRAAGADGVADVRAFYGDYKITVTANGHTIEQKVSFAPGSTPLSVVLR